MPTSLRPELAQRSRRAGLIIGVAALLLVPAWNGFDRLLEPEHAAAFLILRLACDLPIALLVGLLWLRPAGRRHPELLTFLVLTIVQCEVAWMVVRADHHRDVYVLGFSLALYASGTVAGGSWRWTAALSVLSCVAFGAALLSAPHRVPGADLAAAGFFVGTAMIIGVASHAQRRRLAVQELTARVELEAEQARTQELLIELERHSNEDALTGLRNRRSWDAELLRQCSRSARTDEPVTLILLDVDHFKAVNDRFGHGGGDAALRQVAALLLDETREIDVVARLGGDEFGVLLSAPVAGAVELAERLRAGASRITAADVSLSLGVASGQGRTVDPEDLMRRADRALYRAKTTRDSVAADDPNGDRSDCTR